MKKLRLLLVLAAVLALTSGVAATASARAADASGGIPVTFEKQLVPQTNFVFQGTTGGAVNGTLTSMIVPGTLVINGSVWHFTFEWDVTADVAHKSFVALTDGTLDTTTGAVVMDGSVVQGWHQGAHVHEEGQAIGPGAFAGTILILPGERSD